MSEGLPALSHASTTVPIEFVRQLLDGPQLSEAARRFYLSQAAIPLELLASQQARVTTGQFVQLYRVLVMALQDETPGMFSRPLKPGSLKFLSLSLVQATSLMAALKGFTQFFRLVLDDLHFQLRLSGEHVSVGLVPQCDASRQNRFVQEVMLKFVHGMLSWLAGRKIPLAGIELAYPAPAHAPDYVLLFPGPAQFGRPHTLIHFDRDLLLAPVRQHARAVPAFLARAPADWMFISFAERLVSHRVREYLEPRLSGSSSIEDVAHNLLMSTRTMARRLNQEGTGFQAIKDGLRRDVAIRLLTQSQLPATEISVRTGFDDPTAFYRAFKRWTGCSPGVYRRQGQAWRERGE